MDVPNQQQQQTPNGQELLQTVVELTGLPQPLMHQELDQILKATGADSSTLTLDDLRQAMLAYLETLGANLATEEGLNPVTETE